MSDLDIDIEEEEEIDYDKIDLKDCKVHLEACIDNIKDEKDLLIGFDPETVLKNREELKINLIYFDDKITKSYDSYEYYKKFKVNVVGGFYAADEKDIFQKYLEELSQLNDVPPYIVVTIQKNFEDIYNICNRFKFIKEIIILERNKSRCEEYLKTHKKLLKFIAKGYDELIDYLKKIGDLTSKYNKFFKIFNSKRIFTKDEIEMNRQLNGCPIITAYEYDELYFIVHRAYAHFFTNDSLRKDPKSEKEPIFGDTNFKKLKEFLNDFDIEEDKRKNLLKQFNDLKGCENFTEDAIKRYTGETPFCYVLNRVMRNFEKGLIKLAYYVGPLLFGLNRYALNHPELCLKEDTTLFRYMSVSVLDSYIYKLSEGHIICFPSLTSTTLERNKFSTTKLAKKINDDKNSENKNEKTKKEEKEKIEIEIIIKYKHEEGNIPPGIDISNLSKTKSEKEFLLFPFTFFRLNNVAKNPDKQKSFIFDMQIINRKTIIEYDLKEGKRYNIEDLEDNYDENRPMVLDEAKEKTFKVKEKEEENSKCYII